MTKHASLINQPLGQVSRDAIESLLVDKALTWFEPTADPALSRMLAWSSSEVTSNLTYSV